MCLQYAVNGLAENSRRARRRRRARSNVAVSASVTDMSSQNAPVVQRHIGRHVNGDLVSGISGDADASVVGDVRERKLKVVNRNNAVIRVGRSSGDVRAAVSELDQHIENIHNRVRQLSAQSLQLRTISLLSSLQTT